MDLILEILATMLTLLQKPTLAFLIGGMLLAAMGSKFEIPEPVYKFIVILLLLKVGMSAGISVREADFVDLAVPALGVAFVGIAIVLLGARTLAHWHGVSAMDGMATAGLFGALYPFMDVAALFTAIVLARMQAERKSAQSVQGGAMTMGGDSGGSGMPAFD